MTIEAPARTGLLQATGISKHYAGVAALEDVSITLEPGKIHALVGENGAGKSTLMNILGCLDRPSSGTYHLDGEEISNFSSLRSLSSPPWVSKVTTGISVV